MSEDRAPDQADPLPGATDDPRVLEASQQFLRELEQGRRPDRRVWLARYPDLSDALSACFDGLEFMYRASAAVPVSRPERPPLASPTAAPLGDFQLLREIGRGGMGIVYEATQLSLNRRVALKVLPFASSFDTKYLQRFRQEAHAAAQLHHPNIVPVYAVGCERGIHFYAMQLIDGHSLDRVIRQLRHDAGLDANDPPPTSAADPNRTPLLTPPPTEPVGLPADLSAASVAPDDETLARLSTDFSRQRTGGRSQYWRAAARLMAQAAEAIEYAHQQGIVHRDIKPANLLLDTHRKLWIADFGLAHFDAEQNLTQTGELVGTIRYSSPEQVSGQRVVLDHRTDIYSLGATFYELLTLRPIFRGTSRQALMQQVLYQEPTSPRGLERDLPPELETIVLKAVSKNAADRYATAQDLADDLQRFLRDEPIRARRPSLADRARKWARRHPSLVASVVLIMFATLLVSAISNWLVTQANLRTNEALARASARAVEAERRFLQARQAADILIEVGETDLADLPPLTGVRKRLLETALEYYKDFIEQEEGNRSNQEELMTVERRARTILDELAVLEGADQLQLVGETAVQDDLKLAPQQREAINAAVEQFNSQRSALFENLRGGNFSARRGDFLKLARAGEQKVRVELTAAQKQRLDQIAIQAIGPFAFTRAEVISRLKLSTVQRQTLRDLAFAARDARGPRGEKGGRPPRGDGDPDRPRHRLPPDLDFGFGGPPPEPPDRGGPHGPPDEFDPATSRATVEKMLAVLTPEQRAEWDKLVGPPFEGQLRNPRQPPFLRH